MKLPRCAQVVGLALAGAVVVSCLGKSPKLPPAQVPAPPPASKKPYLAQLVLTASPDVNPNASGRPSPIVVRFYQLKDDVAFNGADFFALYDGADKTLGVQLVGAAREFELAPGDRKTADVEISTDTRFVSVLAAFRDIRNAEWRAVLPAGARELTVSVDRARVVLARVGS